MYIIIGGGGDVGYYLARSLLNRGHEVLLLEKQGTRQQTLTDELGPSVGKGDACEARTMEEAGARRADVVIAVTGEDEDNLVICQMAKQHFNVKRTIARVNNPRHEELFKKLGIDVTVSPTRSILALIESELSRPPFLLLMTLKKAGLEIVEMTIDPKAKVVGKRLHDINLPRSSNLALIIRGDEAIFPNAETILMAEDDVYALVNHDGEAELQRTFGT
ncbi:MAG: NAD-binding protein [Ktedonobacteraceae bacterium]